MALVSITGSDLDVVSNFVRTYVQIKSNWADDWETEPYLQAMAASVSTSPGIPTATLLYRYGSIKREDKTAFAQYDPLALVHKYVRIVGIMDGDHVVLWVGVAVEETFFMHGTPDDDPQGDQTITCYGLEHLLDRVALTGAYTDQGYIGWCPPFNEPGRYGAGLDGNCSGSKYGGTYVFSRDAQTWTNYDIVEYLLDRFFPLEVSIDGQADILDALQGVYNFEGLTIRQALDKLIERRRGLGWYVETDGTGPLALVVFSVFAAPITLDGTTYPGNPSTCSLDLADAIDVGANSTRISESTSYDTIVVQGGRMIACFSISYADGNLAAGWTTDLEAEYLNPPGTVEDEDDEETDKRRAAVKYEPVYQRFFIPYEWDWTVNGGSEWWATYNILPASYGVTGWDYPRPLLRWIPIKKEAVETVAAVIDGVADEWEEPFIFVQDTTDNLYHLVDKLPAIDKPGAHVRMLDSDRGFFLKAKFNHLFGVGHFTATNTENNAVYDWQSLVATVAIETDMRLERTISWDPEGEVEKVLVLEVHDAELWYIVPGTVIGCEDGEFRRATTLELVRDDSAKLDTIAELARQWYGTYRAAVRLDLQRIGWFAPLGGIVEEISSGWHREAVNTVLTSRAWDFERQTTTIETGYADLDVRAMMDIPGMSDFRSVGRAFNRMAGTVKDLFQRVSGMPTRLSAGDGLSSAAGVPTVDFWVDMFDRADAATLGDYWLEMDLVTRGEFYRLESGAAIATGVGAGEGLYAASLGGSGFRAKIIAPDKSTVAGVYLGAGKGSGVQGGTLQVKPQISMGAVQYYQIVYTGAGSVGTVNHSGYDAALTAPWEYSVEVGPDGITVTTPFGTSVMSTAPVLNIHGLAQTGGSYSGVESVKFWRSDIPEPPDESGRGKYTGEKHVYSDKYHTTNTTTGAVTYDPTA